MEKLAINGGQPVRTSPFPSGFLGVTMYGEEELAHLTDVINEKSPFRHYGIGNPKKAETFEIEVCKYIGNKFALAVSSGTGALICAVAAMGIGPGDEVILPSFNWFSSFFAITNCGALPVFADIDETLNIDPEDFKRKITNKTKAVIAVSYQGHPPAMDEIMKIANEHNILVIEDIAQAFGAEYKGKKLGTFGHIAIASFQQNKTLCCGEGGIFLTNNEEYFIRAVRYHDLSLMRPVFADKIQNKELLDDALAFAGNQYRMNEFSAAVMLAQIKKIDKVLNICRSHHKKFREAFANNKNFTVRWTEGDCGVAIFILFKSTEETRKFEDALSAEGIPLGPKSACRNLMTQYPIKTKTLSNPSLPPFGKGYNGESVDYEKLNEKTKTDEILSRYIAISIGPMYTNEDINDIITAVNKVYRALYK